MSPTWIPSGDDDNVKRGGGNYTPPTPSTPTTNQDYDDAEKGLYDGSDKQLAPPSAVHHEKPVLLHIETSVSSIHSPMSPIHEGITPMSGVPVLSLSNTVLATPEGVKQLPPTESSDPTGEKKPAPPAGKGGSTKPKRKVSKWILFTLWFNTYKKFFTFVTLLNLVGIILAALGRFPYAENHLGALVLGNLLMAVLMRNELFLRILYMIAIYGLRSVSYHPWQPNKRGWINNADTSETVGTGLAQAGCDFDLATRRGYPFRMCSVRGWMACVQDCRHHQVSCCAARRRHRHGHYYKCFCDYLGFERVSVGSQVCYPLFITWD